MALVVSTWSWGSKYGPEYIQRLKAGVARNLAQPYEFRVFTPEPDDARLTEIKGCFARLRAFDPEWQARQGIEPGDRIVTLDLDLIVTGPLDILFDKPDDLSILQGVNASNPCPFNGSVQMLRAGAYPQVWSDFSVDAARVVPFYEFPDDQAWLAAKVPEAAGWWPEDGVYGFCKPGWPKGEALPRNARIVAFPGWRDPLGFTHLDWVKEHWVGWASGGTVGPGSYTVGGTA